MKNTAWFMVLVVLLIMFITGCVQENQTITYVPNNGDIPVTFEIPKDGVIHNPLEPEKDGFEFLGWYLDNDTFKERFDIDTFEHSSNHQNITVYAKWELKETSLEKYYFLVTIESTAGGSTNPNGLVEVEEGTTLLVEAIPLEGYAFSHWIIEVEGIRNDELTTQILEIKIMEDGIFVQAVFVEEEQDKNSLILESTIHGKTNQEEVGKENSNIVYEISAIPNKGYAFSHWEVVLGEVIIASQEATTLIQLLSMEVVIKACFEKIVAPKTWPLTVISTSGGSLNQEGSWWLQEEEIKTFEAFPEEGYLFSHWEVLAGVATISSLVDSAIEIQMQESEYVLQAVFERIHVEVELTKVYVASDSIHPNEELSIELEMLNRGNIDIAVELWITLRSPSGITQDLLIEELDLSVATSISLVWGHLFLEMAEHGTWDVKILVVRRNSSQEIDEMDATGWLKNAFYVNNPSQKYDILLISTAAVSVNIRSGPGTSYPVVGVLPKDAMAPYVRKVNDYWFETIYLQEKAYISTSFSELYYFEKASQSIEEIIHFGKTLIGAPYVYGAQRYHWGAPNAVKNSNFVMGLFDCSSFTQYIYYMSAGIILNVTTRTQIVQGVHVPLENLSRGDLMFFTNSSREHNVGIERVGHVAIYLGSNYILHTSSNVATIEPISAARWNYYIEARRVVE